MEEKMEEKSYKIFTIPNILTFCRIVIIVPFIIGFLKENYILASTMLIISGLTDCCDGFLARKLNQVTEIGKMLDPIADKLTLLAVGVCICILVPYVLPFMMVLIIKDILMLCGASALIKNGKMPPAAKWYGKLGTILFYLSVITIVFFKAVFNYESIILSTVLLSVTGIVMIFALIKYFMIFVNLLKDEDYNN